MSKSMLALLVSVLLVGGSQFCRASTITLTSSSAGVYDYGLTLNGGETVAFSHNQTITLSGLSGVTEASVGGDLNFGGFTVSSFTSTSVVYAQTGADLSTFSNTFSTPSTFGTFVVDSSVLTTGTIDFSMETSSGTVAGTVDGPVAAAEPGSLLLLTVALVVLLLGALWVEKRRRRAVV